MSILKMRQTITNYPASNLNLKFTIKSAIDGSDIKKGTTNTLHLQRAKKTREIFSSACFELHQDSDAEVGGRKSSQKQKVLIAGHA